VTAELTRLHVLLAEQILRFLDAAAEEPVRRQVTEAMKIYERDVLHEQTWQS
jgi:hypothetical protein